MEEQKNCHVSSGLMLLKDGNSGGRRGGKIIPFLVFALK